MNFHTTEDHLPIEFRHAALSFTEQRTFEATEIRVEKGDDGKTHLVGYAAVFNSRSKPLKTKSGKTFVEQIQPGAFKRSLENNKDIVMLYNHDPSRVLARTSAKTLKLSEDDRGLRFDATLPDTTLAHDVTSDVDHGNVRGVSFGFNDPEDKWDMDGDVPVRTLLSIPVGEVSPTPFPAYPATEISVRAIEMAIDRVAAGEPDVRGKYVPDSDDLHDMLNSCRSMCRSATEYTHQTLRSLQKFGDPAKADDHLVRCVRDLHSAMGECRSKMAECRSHMAGSWLNEDDATDIEPTAAGQMDSTRFDRLMKQLQVAIDEGLPTDDLRAAIASGVLTVNQARTEEATGGSNDQPAAA